MPGKKISILLILIMSSVMAACSGLKATSTGGNGGGGGGGVGVTATISVDVTGLAQGASVIFQNKGGDSLTVTTDGTFSFKTPTNTYDVTVNTQPTTPNQICTVTNGQGTPATATVTIMVNCVNSYTIGGTVAGLRCRIRMEAFWKTCRFRPLMEIRRLPSSNSFRLAARTP